MDTALQITSEFLLTLDLDNFFKGVEYAAHVSLITEFCLEHGMKFGLPCYKEKYVDILRVISKYGVVEFTTDTGMFFVPHEWVHTFHLKQILTLIELFI